MLGSPRPCFVGTSAVELQLASSPISLSLETQSCGVTTRLSRPKPPQRCVWEACLSIWGLGRAQRLGAETCL